jgi:hypothetical protein
VVSCRPTQTGHTLVFPIARTCTQHFPRSLA